MTEDQVVLKIDPSITQQRELFRYIQINACLPYVYFNVKASLRKRCQLVPPRYRLETDLH